jgi:hypothetical protein
MKLPNAVYEARPWRIHEIVCDFMLEDVWAVPVDGGAGHFSTLLDVVFSLDFPSSASLPTRFLWAPVSSSAESSASAGFRLRPTARGTVPQENCRFRGRGNPL